MLGRRSARRILNSRKYSEQITIVQQGAGERDSNGEYIDGAEMRFTLRASIENVGLQTMKLLRDNSEAGERIIDARYFFIPAQQSNFVRPLRVGPNQTDNDRIIYNGLSYAVSSMDDFSNHGHIEVIATRTEGQDDDAATRNR